MAAASSAAVVASSVRAAGLLPGQVVASKGSYARVAAGGAGSQKGGPPTDPFPHITKRMPRLLEAVRRLRAAADDRNADTVDAVLARHAAIAISASNSAQVATLIELVDCLQTLGARQVPPRVFVALSRPLSPATEALLPTMPWLALVRIMRRQLAIHRSCWVHYSCGACGETWMLPPFGTTANSFQAAKHRDESPGCSVAASAFLAEFKRDVAAPLAEAAALDLALSRCSELNRASRNLALISLVRDMRDASSRLSKATMDVVEMRAWSVPTGAPTSPDTARLATDCGVGHVALASLREASGTLVGVLRSAQVRTLLAEAATSLLRLLRWAEQRDAVVAASGLTGTGTLADASGVAVSDSDAAAIERALGEDSDGEQHLGVALGSGADVDDWTPVVAGGAGKKKGRGRGRKGAGLRSAH